MFNEAGLRVVKVYSWILELYFKCSRDFLEIVVKPTMSVTELVHWVWKYGILLSEIDVGLYWPLIEALYNVFLIINIVFTNIDAVDICVDVHS